MDLIISGKSYTAKKRIARGGIPPEDIFNNGDPYAAIQSGKVMAKAWAKTLSEADHIAQSQTFVFRIIEAYWQKTHLADQKKRSLPFLFRKISVRNLDNSVMNVAEAIGNAAAGLPVIEAGYLIGNVYTAVLPESIRSAGGVFYTPPALSARLIDLAERAGINWSAAKVLDPACGGGAFLAPVCIKILEAIKQKKPKDILKHIQSHVVGWEIDPFGGWLTQVFAEVVLKDIINQAGMKLPPLVTICDSLRAPGPGKNAGFDFVIGNPPYGKLKLTDVIRKNFGESLFGHPNLYGLFTHLAANLAKQNGIIALLTPTSFLSGEYFKNLRHLLRKTTAPAEIDFVSFRKGVFDDVLQETMLAVYKKGGKNSRHITVNQVTTFQGKGIHIGLSGTFPLPGDLSAPWILPRTPAQALPVNSMKKMNFRLADWGYHVSTGPLVWNRHKAQLVNKHSSHYYPVIWAESITQDGRFLLRADKKNHHPYFKFQPGDEWLIVKRPCILLQRTTAKEQEKRLIAAALPGELLKKGVVVENHLNMIIPGKDIPRVSPETLAAFLNSKAVNEAFRTISGSVAVSAYELESFPLPSPGKLKQLNQLVAAKCEQSIIEEACQLIYTNHQ